MSQPAQSPIKVAVVRGEHLNPFEMQTIACMRDVVTPIAIGRQKPRYDVNSLGVPSRLLPSLDQLSLTRRLEARLPSRYRDNLSLHKLIGLRAAVRGCHVLHSAEIMLAITEQCVELARVTGAATVTTCWENIPFRSYDAECVPARKARVVGAVDRFIAVTPKAKRALLEEGVAPDRVDVIPAGVDCCRFKPEGPTANLRKRLGVAPATEGLLFLYVGRLIKEKGVVELIRAFARSTATNAHLVFVGTGDQDHRMRQACEALGVTSRIHMIGSASYEDLPGYLRDADAVVAPSLSTPYWQEQFGMVLAEAMACGRPVITTDSGSIPEVVGDAALVVREYDIDALAIALSTLAASPEERERLSRKARCHALDSFHAPRVAAQIEASYAAALEAQRSKQRLPSCR